MFEALDNGKLKAIWIIGTNPCVSMPDVHKATRALQKAKFVVVQDISKKSDTLAFADVVFPAATWAEKEGTMTNAERRISYLNRIVDAPGEALPDSAIICRFARKMGYHGFDFQNTAEIFAEHAALTEGTHIDISGLDYPTLKQNPGVQWPWPKSKNAALPGQQNSSDHQHDNTQQFFHDGQFFTRSKKAVIHSFDDNNHSESLSPDYPLILTTGRIRDQWHTMTRSGKVSKLKQHTSESYLEIHPSDAASRNIHESSLVEITNERGKVRVKARLTGDVKKGVVFLPMHWGKVLSSELNRANNLTSTLVDPISKEPDFKFSAVQVSLFKKERQKIIVIGAGAGACGIVKTYRALNHTDEIEIFSREDFPFYNRVLLPDYITGALKWQNLVKMSEKEEYEHKITLHRGISITSIDREGKNVTDSIGNVHYYDKLIIATGSRPAMMRDVPPMRGIFTMRSRSDADAFKEYSALRQGNVVIVGGGLLGIELASALREINVKVTIIQRISRLMDRQLDPLGSQLLHEELADRGVDIYYNDEIERFLGDITVSGIRLKSGLMVECASVVIAIGTVPDIELARQAGIECKRGVIVDEYLRTNDPHIFAIGEIAEFKGFLYGITAAAEQQAEIVCRFLCGDVSRYYEGSLLMNILKMHGTELCSLGQVEYPAESGYEEVVFIDKAKRYYKKCIIHNDRLIGAILIGDKSEFLEYRSLIESKMELSEKRLQLLRSGKTPEPVIGKLICSCNNVGEGNLVNRIREGCKDHLQLCQLTGAGMGCGSCRPEVRLILEKTLQTEAQEISPVNIN
jgi:ferredoxin-nitrate reductase